MKNIKYNRYRVHIMHVKNFGQALSPWCVPRSTTTIPTCCWLHVLDFLWVFKNYNIIQFTNRRTPGDDFGDIFKVYIDSIS